MKKRNIHILGGLILGIILSCAGGAAAQTVWVACAYDTSVDVPVKGRPARFERRIYVSEAVSMSTRDFLEAEKQDGQIGGRCGSYLERTVIKGGAARGEDIYTGGKLQIFKNISTGDDYLRGGAAYVYSTKEAVEKLRDDWVKSWQDLDRKVYKFNWDPSGRNETADLQRETSGGGAPVSQNSVKTGVQPNLPADDTSGDIKDRIGSLITLPANQIPLKQPKFLVINSLKEDADYVLGGKDLAEILKKEQIESDEYLDGKIYADKTGSALQKMKMLFEAGTPATEVIQLKNGNLTLGELAEMMLKINRDAAAIVMINRLEQNTMQALVWVNDAGTKGKLGYNELEAAVRSGEELQKSVSDAQKLGFPDDYKLNVQDHDYTLPDLREMGHYVAAAGGQVKAEVDAARNAKDQPYLKVLGGDKARIFKQEFGGQGGMWEAYGSGGKVLNSPAAMSGATVWFTYGNSRGIIDTWHITGWKFQGDKLVGTISRSGYGLKPSAAAFR